MGRNRFPEHAVASPRISRHGVVASATYIVCATAQPLSLIPCDKPPGQGLWRGHERCGGPSRARMWLVMQSLLEQAGQARPGRNPMYHVGSSPGG